MLLDYVKIEVECVVVEISTKKTIAHNAEVVFNNK